jgi:hypothetical protein
MAGAPQRWEAAETYLGEALGVRQVTVMLNEMVSEREGAVARVTSGRLMMSIHPRAVTRGDRKLLPDIVTALQGNSQTNRLLQGGTFPDKADLEGPDLIGDARWLSYLRRASGLPESDIYAQELGLKVARELQVPKGWVHARPATSRTDLSRQGYLDGTVAPNSLEIRFDRRLARVVAARDLGTRVARRIRDDGNAMSTLRTVPGLGMEPLAPRIRGTDVVKPSLLARAHPIVRPEEMARVARLQPPDVGDHGHER